MRKFLWATSLMLVVHVAAAWSVDKKKDYGNYYQYYILCSNGSSSIVKQYKDSGQVYSGGISGGAKYSSVDAAARGMCNG